MHRIFSFGAFITILGTAVVLTSPSPTLAGLERFTGGVTFVGCADGIRACGALPSATCNGKSRPVCSAPMVKTPPLKSCLPDPRDCGTVSVTCTGAATSCQ
jgi:hypothetical protein